VETALRPFSVNSDVKSKLPPRGLDFVELLLCCAEEWWHINTSQRAQGCGRIGGHQRPLIGKASAHWWVSAAGRVEPMRGPSWPPYTGHPRGANQRNSEQIAIGRSWPLWTAL